MTEDRLEKFKQYILGNLKLERESWEVVRVGEFVYVFPSPDSTFYLKLYFTLRGSIGSVEAELVGPPLTLDLLDECLVQLTDLNFLDDFILKNKHKVQDILGFKEKAKKELKGMQLLEIRQSQNPPDSNAGQHTNGPAPFWVSTVKGWKRVANFRSAHKMRAAVLEVLGVELD